jgi:cell division septation protein DedD
MLLVVSGSVQAAPPAASPAESPACGWQVAGYPNSNPDYQILYGLGAISPTDVWAVGSSQARDQAVQSLIVHWDGAAWSIIPSPRPGTASEFTAVAAVSANDVWAVGWYWPASGGENTLVAHWDGQSWTQVPSPNFGIGNSLDDIVVVSANDIWAVGGYGNAPGDGGPLAMHWNSLVWTIVPTPNGPQGPALLWSVTAISSNDIWAVGDENVPLGAVHTDNTFTIHWDGIAWTHVPSPNVGDRNNIFYAVDAVSTNDVWAAGTRYNRADATWYPLFPRWNGTEWKIEASPNAGPSSNFVNGITAISSDNVWAVGLDFSRQPRGVLMHHWDGVRWNLVNVPQPQGHNDAWDVTHISADEVWFAGKNFHYEGIRRDIPMIGRYTGECGGGTPTPTPLATNTPAATATRTATNAPTSTSQLTSTQPPVQTSTPPNGPTNTPTTQPVITPTNEPTIEPTAAASPTSGACTVEFSDVQPGSTFYPYVMCLACRDILSGYADGTFRPEAAITRGQISKVVSNGAGFDDDVTGRETYTDVSSGSTFWVWIERLSMHEVLGGYACGAPGEPCDSQNRHYFRPGSNATRGQIARIVSNAAGFSDVPSGQIFDDVPSTHTMYTPIQRLASRGIIGGYPCGAPGEPCNAENRP